MNGASAFKVPTFANRKDRPDHSTRAARPRVRVGDGESQKIFGTDAGRVSFRSAPAREAVGASARSYSSEELGGCSFPRRRRRPVTVHLRASEISVMIGGVSVLSSSCLFTSCTAPSGERTGPWAGLMARGHDVMTSESSFRVSQREAKRCACPCPAQIVTGW